MLKIIKCYVTLLISHIKSSLANILAKVNVFLQMCDFIFTNKSRLLHLQ